MVQKVLAALGQEAQRGYTSLIQRTDIGAADAAGDVQLSVRQVLDDLRYVVDELVLCAGARERIRFGHEDAGVRLDGHEVIRQLAPTQGSAVGQCAADAVLFVHPHDQSNGATRCSDAVRLIAYQ